MTSPSRNQATITDGLEAGRVLNGKYRVIRLLGEGGMGAVFEANHELIAKRVVIKVLHPEMLRDPKIVERFRREAIAATSVGNEHIVDVTDMGELDDGSPFIVMEFLEGRSLGEVLDDEGALGIGRTVQIVRQICDGLHAAHAKNIIHRDMKPDNVFLIERKGAEFVKVLDFGISKVQEAKDVESRLTKTGTAMGTPIYMSPEQAQGLKSLDHRTDVYAVGVILFEMLSGDLPFKAETYPALLLKAMTQEPPPLTSLRADVPVALAELVHRTMAKDADARPADMAELAELLAPFERIEATPELIGARDPKNVDPSFLQTAAARPATERHGSHDPNPTMAGQAGTSSSSPGAPSTGAGGTGAGGTGAGSTGAGSTGAGNTGAGNTGAGNTGAGSAGAGGTGVGMDGDGTAASSASVSDPELSFHPTATPLPRESAPAGGGSNRILYGLGGLAAVLGIVGMVIAWQASGTTAPPPPPPTPVTADAEVRVRIRVSPADATIRLAGVEYPNPMDALRPRSLDPVTLEITREGFRSLERPLVLDQDRDYDFQLAEAPATPEPTPVAEEEASTNEASGRTGRRPQGRRGTSNQASAETTETTESQGAGTATSNQRQRPPPDDGVYHGRQGDLRREW